MYVTEMNSVKNSVFPVSFVQYDCYSLSILSMKMLTSAF